MIKDVKFLPLALLFPCALLLNVGGLLCIELSTTKKKGKAIPLQAWTGPEGSSRLRLPDFKIIGT